MWQQQTLFFFLLIFCENNSKHYHCNFFLQIVCHAYSLFSTDFARFLVLTVGTLVGHLFVCGVLVFVKSWHTPHTVGAKRLNLGFFVLMFVVSHSLISYKVKKNRLSILKPWLVLSKAMSVCTCEELVWGTDELVWHFDCLCLKKEIKMLPVRIVCVTWRIVCCVLQKVFNEIENWIKAKNVCMLLLIWWVVLVFEYQVSEIVWQVMILYVSSWKKL